MLAHQREIQQRLATDINMVYKNLAHQRLIQQRWATYKYIVHRIFMQQRLAADMGGVHKLSATDMGRVHKLPTHHPDCHRRAHPLRARPQLATDMNMVHIYQRKGSSKLLCCAPDSTLAGIAGSELPSRAGDLLI